MLARFTLIHQNDAISNRVCVHRNCGRRNKRVAVGANEPQNLYPLGCHARHVAVTHKWIAGATYFRIVVRFHFPIVAAMPSHLDDIVNEHRREAHHVHFPDLTRSPDELN